MLVFECGPEWIDDFLCWLFTAHRRAVMMNLKSVSDSLWPSQFCMHAWEVLHFLDVRLAAPGVCLTHCVLRLLCYLLGTWSVCCSEMHGFQTMQERDLLCFLQAFLCQLFTASKLGANVSRC